jgi:putative membrane protein
MIAMFPCAGFGYGLWWVFPLIMVVMMVLCFFMMRGRMVSTMRRSGFCRTSSHDGEKADSVFETLNKQYARGDINKEEYEEKKKSCLDTTDHRRNDRF